jgi:hypothetical protein
LPIRCCGPPLPRSNRGLRLALWSRVLGRFFARVFAAVILLLLSGYTMVFEVFGGFAKIGIHIQLMQSAS